MASAMMLRAEFPVHRKSTFNRFESILCHLFGRDLVAPSIINKTLIEDLLISLSLYFNNYANIGYIVEEIIFVSLLINAVFLLAWRGA